MHIGTARESLILTVALFAAGCASIGEMVATPDVALRDVHVESIELSGQTFVLSFDISNPNPFPLPVREVSYGIVLAGHRFASGEAQSAFTVPAGGEGEFAVSVDVNLLKTAPELLFIVREGMRHDIPYALEGTLGVDIPYAKPMRFTHEGAIQLQAAAYSR